MIYLSKEPFNDGTADCPSCGFDFSITVDKTVFRVRNYLDAPGEFTVISPLAEGQSPEARQLADYLTSVLGGERMYFFDPQVDVNREIDLLTLEYMACEAAPANPALKPVPIAQAVPPAGGLQFARA